MGDQIRVCDRFFWLLTSDRTIIVQITIIKDPNILINNILGF